MLVGTVDVGVPVKLTRHPYRIGIPPRELALSSPSPDRERGPGGAAPDREHRPGGEALFGRLELHATGVGHPVGGVEDLERDEIAGGIEVEDRLVLYAVTISGSTRSRSTTTRTRYSVWRDGSGFWARCSAREDLALSPPSPNGERGPGGEARGGQGVRPEGARG
jgi:hypothetical protein